MQNLNNTPRSPLASLCDKCGEIVSPDNSMLRLEELINGPMIGNVRDRHLFPYKNCPGSPSRVKLIETNSKYAEAYRRMKSRAAASKN
ncbi:MAG TPA: hypothetical protein PK530_18730 [Anaerolineales bacterium]|nr:hypothetical protein [Anaerolineales bacterium]